jgi:16S rRNA (adenine1518-N6/adenine1519-N6)-dimethyltransferase
MNISDLKVLWDEHGFRPEKLLGQNFLIDKNVRDKIIREIGFVPDDVVIEIGPGFGVMTLELAAAVKEVVAVEKDSRVCSIMEEFFEGAGNIKLVEGDFLEADIPSLVTGRSIIYGNIPYYITTPLIEKIIANRPYVKSAYLVMQQEYADRLAAKPATPEYGSITCFVQFHAAVKKIMKISRSCFFPQPNVDSCLVRLEICDRPPVDVKDPERMFGIIRKSFSQRRKMMFKVLANDLFLGLDRAGWEDVAVKCGIGPGKRGEELSLAEFARISDAVG